MPEIPRENSPGEKEMAQQAKVQASDPEFRTLSLYKTLGMVLYT